MSEGRDAATIERLADAAEAISGVALIDRSSDADHHRTVLTLVGGLDPLRRALLALYEVALARIDLRRHRGVHPRVGAVDVVPIVPLGEASMADAVEAARALGEEVAARHGLPVFLYEEAATAPERRNLAEIRRGGLAGLEARLADGGWVPDFGPPRLHPSGGAAVIGARGLLIALNAILDTADVTIARRVARAVREANGGLPALKAIGVPLATRGRAQVSMNLTDFRRTMPAAALAAAREVAARHGARVVEAELVGLIPEAALAGTSAEELGIRGFRPERTLEHHLRRLQTDEAGGQAPSSG